MFGSQSPYYGTYAVNESEKTLAVKLRGSTYANLVGGPEQKRIVTSITAEELKVYESENACWGHSVNRVETGQHPMIQGRGRDEDFSPPPAQIPASAANAPGSSLGFWRRSGEEAADVAP